MFARYYIISNLFAKRNKKFKASINIQLLKYLYIDFLMYLSFFLKHSRNNLNIDNNIKFVIQIKIYFVKTNNKTKINILEKTILYCFINQFSKISSILRSNNKNIQLNIISYLAYLTLRYTF